MLIMSYPEAYMWVLLIVGVTWFVTRYGSRVVTALDEIFDAPDDDDPCTFCTGTCSAHHPACPYAVRYPSRAPVKLFDQDQEEHHGAHSDRRPS